MSTASLAHATKRGEVQLIRKTSSRVVHTFTEALFPIGELSFSSDNETQVKHWCIHHPKRLCYLSRSRPGLTEGQVFKSLSLDNLHPCVNTFTLSACYGELSEQHTVVWDAVVHLRCPESTMTGTVTQNHLHWKYFRNLQGLFNQNKW